MASADPATLTGREAARMIGTSERNVRRLVTDGRLVSHPGPRGTRILHHADVERYLQTHGGTVTQEEAATELGVDVRTIRRMLKSGRLSAVEMASGRLRVARAGVDAAKIAQADGTGHGDRTGHEDGTGQLDSTGHADETGHAIGSCPDMTGHDVSGASEVSSSGPRYDAALTPLTPLPAPEPVTLSRPARAARRGRSLVALVAVVALALGVSVAFAALRARHDVSAPRTGHVTTTPASSSTVTGPATSTPTAAPGVPVVTKPTKKPKPKAIAHHVRRPKPRPVAPRPGPPVRVPDPECMAIYGPAGLC